MFKLVHYIRILLVSVVLMIGIATSVHTKDIIADLMHGTVATVSDAARLLFYSFNPFSNNTSKGKKSINDRKHLSLQLKKMMLSSQVSQRQLSQYLHLHGIELRVTNRAITRAQFAKTIMKRFDLEKSFMTSVLGWESLYYSDAQKLGIFPINKKGSGNITTKSLLKAFLRAKKVSHSKN